MLSALGSRIRSKLESLGDASGFFLFLMKETLLFPRKRRIGARVLIMQIYFTGVEALSVIAILSLGLGAVIILQGKTIMPLLGNEVFYKILILIIMRELGPMMTAFIIIARSGSAITTELGNMVISHEMEAYMSAGINPISQLGVPRLIGVTVAMVLLNIYFNIFGLMGSYLVTSLLEPFPFRQYISSLAQQITLVDAMASLIKSFLFGIIISVVSTYYGFRVQHAITEVPQMTIKSIGVSMVLCIFVDGIIILFTQL